MEQKWSLEIENKKEESEDNKEGSEDDPGESQEEETPLSTSCWNNDFVSLVFFTFLFCFLWSKCVSKKIKR